MSILKGLSKKVLKLEFLFPIIIFFIAFGLRIYTLNENLFFGWEQGRDALIVQEILSGQKLTLIGPKTDIEGVFHGAFYYYLLAIPYLLGKGNPLIAAYFWTFIQALGAVVIFFIAKNELRPITRAGASLIYAFSFQGIVFSRWLSNPSLCLPLTVFFLYNLKEKFEKNNFFLAIIFWGLIFHLELIAALFLFPVLVYYFLKSLKNLKPRIIAQTVFLLLFIFSPYFIFDLRHDHLLFKGFLNLLGGAKEAQLNVWNFLKDLVIVFQREFSLSMIPKFPFLVKFIFLTGIICLFWERKKYLGKLIFLGLISPFLLIIVVKTIPMSQTLIASLPFFYLFCAVIIEKILDFKRLYFLGIGLILFIIFSNFLYYQETIPQNKNLFFHAYQYTFLGDQKRILDFIYKEADGQNFSFNYYSFPYWLPHGWNYHFSWYGKEKYGYLPQVQRTETFFVIIEPDEVDKKRQDLWYENFNKESKVLETFTSRNLKVEKRTIL